MEQDKELLSNFLNDFLSKKNPTQSPPPILPKKKVENVENTFIPKTDNIKEIKISNNNIKYDYSKFEEIYIDELPLGFMYNKGLSISIRVATVKEIQDFSTFEYNNPFDFKYKINDILENCVLIKDVDGQILSYRTIIEGDRNWLLYTIREKTFPQGKVLTVTVKYKKNDETKNETIEIKRENIDVYRNESIMEFFDDDKKVFVFETELRKEPFILAPPTLGLANCFDQFFEENAKNKKLNTKQAPFYKIAPYLKPHVVYMSYEEIEEFQRWFESELTPEEFAFLLDLINNHLTIGIRGLKKNTDFGILRTPKIYPDKPSNIFIVPNAFDVYRKK